MKSNQRPLTGEFSYMLPVVGPLKSAATRMNSFTVPAAHPFSSTACRLPSAKNFSALQKKLCR
jgi:hypothetical protein